MVMTMGLMGLFIGADRPFTANPATFELRWVSALKGASGPRGHR
jgi:hypothetical protein